jgi:hypothetical protein
VTGVGRSGPAAIESLKGRSRRSGQLDRCPAILWPADLVDECLSFARDAEAERTLLLAVLRGALLDLLATGDIERITRAVDRHLRSIHSSTGYSSTGHPHTGESATRVSPGATSGHAP